MAVGYILMALVVILMNLSDIPAVLTTIVRNAFGWEEAVSGGMGAAIAQGLRRGLFSNEAGLGSAPNVAATAHVRHPISQGITQAFSVDALAAKKNGYSRPATGYRHLQR